MSTLDATFSALADPTRRAILRRLMDGEATVKELAKPHRMSLPSISRHLKVLESAGLIVKGREAQWRPCRLEAAPLEEADAWMAPYRKFFETRFERLERQLAQRTEEDEMSNADDAKHEFTLTWMLNASPADVFRAWTDPEHLDWFYNPDQPRPTEPIELDLRVGGGWRQRMVIDEDTSYATGGVYREIVPDRKLVFSWGATDGWPKLDLERLDENPLVSVTLRAAGSQTEMKVHVELSSGLSDAAAQQWWSLGIQNGWRDTVDRLANSFAPLRAG